MEGPTKNEISEIFKRLKSEPGNKVCFDCSSKNPTWSSVTYGIFICIDCSGIHRSLGVHLTFVRSTQLDSNWTWQQLRQMQLGGNTSASVFFRKHNCTTTDTQSKYKSRAAQLYREKLHNAAVKAIKLHGNKLFIQSSHVQEEEESAVSSSKEEEQGQQDDFFSQSHNLNPSLSPVKSSESLKPDLSADGPSVNLTPSSEASAPRKSTIANKRNQAKKSGLGAKKVGGLGATRVKKDFAEIEKEAEIEEQMQSKGKEDHSKSPIDEAAVTSSMRLAYKDISVQQQKTEEKLKKTDPKKAEQVERLGMGLRGSTGVSHSLMTDMGIIVQEPAGFSKRSEPEYSSVTVDDYDVINDGFKGFSEDNDKSSWENEFEKLKVENKRTNDLWSNNFEDKSSMSRPKPSIYGSGSSEDATKKFGNAKAISSDMYFGDSKNDSPDANLTRFQGSNSISSAEYFNRTEVIPSSSRIQSPDMEDVKESVRQGVSKVAGKLSGMASGVMTQLQEKYGY